MFRFFLRFRFHNILVNSKKKKKKKHFTKYTLFKNNFWFFESKINIFLVRIGFIKNLTQSNFLIKKQGVSLNNQLVDVYNKKILKDCFKVSALLKDIKLVRDFLKLLSKKIIIKERTQIWYF